MHIRKLAYSAALFTLSLILLLPGCKKDDSIKNVTASKPSPGEIYISPFTYQDETSGNIMILDSAGNILLDRPVDAEATGFRRWDISNTIYYSYFLHEPDGYHIPEVGYVPGTLILMDEDMNDLKRLRLLPYNGRTPDDPDLFDTHEFILIGPDHYIATAYFEKEVDNIPQELNPAANCKVVAPIIQEVQNGEVVFEWDGTNYPEFYTSSRENNDFYSESHTHDYMHINSVYIDPNDNNLICSFRNLDQVIKIQRTTGDIVWRLGGETSDFTMTDDMLFYRQHHATLINNGQTLILFDNGSQEDRAYTRIVEFDLDETGMQITRFSYMDLPDGMFAQYMGSVQKKGNNYFIGCGAVPRVIEVNSLTRKIVLDIELDETTYRAYKL